MIRITPTAINSGNIEQLTPLGFDGGNGFSKLTHGDGVIVSPSYYLDLRSATETPNIIEYLDVRWVTGDPTDPESPVAYARVSDE
jgi:hypothetical protein